MSFQVINNACATQAIVSVLLNSTHPDMLLGETLTEFREFSLSFDAAVSPRIVLVVTGPDDGQRFLRFCLIAFSKCSVSSIIHRAERLSHILIKIDGN